MSPRLRAVGGRCLCSADMLLCARVGLLCDPRGRVGVGLDHGEAVVLLDDRFRLRVFVVERDHEAAGVRPDVLVLVGRQLDSLDAVRVAALANQLVLPIAAEVFGIAPAQITITDALLPEAAPYAVFHAVFAFHSTDEEILCVGHAPNVDKVIAVALTGERQPVTQLKKAGAAMLFVEDLPRTRGELGWLIPPKVLAAL